MSQKPGQVPAASTFDDWLTAFNTLETIVCEVVVSPTGTPSVTDDDYDVGTKWIKEDTNEAWVLVHTTVTNDAIWLALGSTPGALLNTGAVPLIAPWDAGPYNITAQRLVASQADDGNSPLIVTSTTTVTNLSADTVDGIQGAEIVKRDGSVALTGNWNVGAFDITNVADFSCAMITATVSTETRLDLDNIVAKFGSGVAQTGYSLGRPINTGTLTLTGGASSGGGGNIILYGSSYPTGGQANDIELRAAGAVKMRWDHSGNAWSFLSQDITNIGLFDGRDVAVDGAKLDLIEAEANKYVHPSHTGDVTGSAALTIAADAVTNAKLANIVGQKLKGRATAGTGDPEDFDIIGLPEKASPDVTDFLLGQEAGGTFKKFGAGSWNPQEPVLLRNPYKQHISLGTRSSGTENIDCEHYPSAYLRCNGATIGINLNFPANVPDNRGTDTGGGFALSGKVWVKNASGGTINVTDTNADTFITKGAPGFNTDEWSVLVWEFWDDGVESFGWAEWVND